ncbi:hypothetical protein CO2235_150043 [Cupriavidus oxalaticus]|uniref:Uncharacterized protein n=1 Tax=Cupriavidus oxalaticus TaxID=96344 RepID=A0A375G2U6_9BURK|nr:hypothetical protein CO2235_150043 [Cupriavidus oxalaticus]
MLGAHNSHFNAVEISTLKHFATHFGLR